MDLLVKKSPFHPNDSITVEVTPVKQDGMGSKSYNAFVTVLRHTFKNSRITMQDICFLFNALG